MNTQSQATRILLSDLATWSLQGLVAGIFFASGIVQIAGIRAEVLLFDELGLGQWLRVVTGVLELGGAIALVSPRTASIGGLSLTVLMAGAAFASLTVLPVNPGPTIALTVLTSLIVYLRRDTLFALLQPVVARTSADSRQPF